MNPVQILDNTEAIHKIGEVIMNYQPYQNAYLNALVNRIGRVIITSKLWRNPWAPFKKGFMEFGETVEEIFVNIAKPHSFDPAVAEKEVFKREIPDVRAAFHTMNFQKFYKVTISNDQLRQSFLSWQGITDLIAKIVDSLYTGMEKDEFVTMKYLLCRYILNGGMYVQTQDPVTNDNYKPMVANFREMSTLLTYLSPTYNAAGVQNATARDDQFIIISAALEANIDVEVLAAAFNMGKADFLGHLVIVDSFSVHDTERLQELFGDDDDYVPFTAEEIATLESINATVVGRDFFMIFDNFQQFTENYNGQGLYWQYFYHVWKTFSCSPFENAMVFYGGESKITGVTVSPSSANVSQGSNIQLTATVAGTGLIKKDIVWSIEGETASGTHIDPYTGNLHIAADEPITNADGDPAVEPIKVTATAIDNTSASATITVVAGQ